MPRAPELQRRLPRTLIAIALALPVLLVVGVLIASQVLGRDEAPTPGTQRLAVAAVPVPVAASADCARLLSGLPDALATGGTLLPRRLLADPVPAGTVAWGGLGGDVPGGRTPVVLRCGLPRPPELTPTSVLVDVDGVSWLPLPAGPVTTYVAVDRSVFLSLEIGEDAGTGALQDVSRGVKITLASRGSG